MKKLCILPMLLMIPSCSTIQSTRENLAQMSDEDFTALAFKIHFSARTAGSILTVILKEKGEVLGKIQTSILDVATELEKNSIRNADIMSYITDKLSQIPGLGAEEQDIIRSAGYLVSSIVGPIQLNVDGHLTDREMELLDAFLTGIFYGVSQ